MPDIVFLDTETFGLDLSAPIWEFAAKRITPDGELVAAEHMFIRHNPTAGTLEYWLDQLPQAFRDDYHARYDDRTAVWPYWAIPRICQIVEGGALIAGSNPSFDMLRVERLCGRHGYTPEWHYHPIDIPTLVHGYLTAKHGVMPPQPWKSDRLSAALGVDPARFDRHTAMGDVDWTLAQWRAVMAGA